MEELISQLFDMGVFTDSMMIKLATQMNLSQLDVALIIDKALAKS